MKKEYLTDFTGCTGSIKDNTDGSARLIIKTPQGVKVHDKVHKTHNSAKQAWNRFVK